MTTQSQPPRFPQAGWLGSRIKDKARPVIHRLLGRKVLKRPTAQKRKWAKLGDAQQKFAKGPR